MERVEYKAAIIRSACVFSILFGGQCPQPSPEKAYITIRASLRTAFGALASTDCQFGRAYCAVDALAMGSARSRVRRKRILQYTLRCELRSGRSLPQTANLGGLIAQLTLSQWAGGHIFFPMPDCQKSSTQKSIPIRTLPISFCLLWIAYPRCA